MRRLYHVVYTIASEDSIAFPKGVSSSYISKVNQLWGNIEKRLDGIGWRMDKVYADHFHEGGNFDEWVFKGRPNYRIIKRLKENGAELIPTVDRILFLEYEAWKIEAIKQKTDVVTELFLRTAQDNGIYISKKIDETLKDNETAIAFLSALQSWVKLPSDVEVTMWDPLDAYGNITRLEDLAGDV